MLAKLTRQDVVTAFYLLLGRPPESDEVVQNFIDYADFNELRGAILGSSEYAQLLSLRTDYLSISPIALMMSGALRRCQQWIESLLSLPVHGRSVLLFGDDVAALATFFLDRHCRVQIVAGATTCSVAHACFAPHPALAANVSFVEADASVPCDASMGRYEIVCCDLPPIDSHNMRAWIDSVSRVCGDILVLGCSMAPGRAEEIFVAQRADRSVYIPSQNWVSARLGERFERVSEPRLLIDDGQVSDRMGGREMERTALYVAYRTELSVGETPKYAFDQA